MLGNLFENIAGLSLTAGIITLVVLLLRLCFRKAPRWLICAAWGLVALRLLIPVTLQSPFSLLPEEQPITAEQVTVQLPAEPREETPRTGTDEPIRYTYRAPVIHSGIDALDERVNPILREQFAPALPENGTGTEAPAEAPLDRFLNVAAVIWLIGVAAMLLYALGSHFVLSRRLADSLPYGNEKGIRRSDRISTPFILGIFRPVIYLPSGIDPKVVDSVIAHERTHLRRGDHLLKPLGFLLLGIYWFNPLLWVAYAVFCRDIEFACDEKVVRALREDERCRYAEALLACGIKSTVRRNSITACPLAFGEVGIKERMKKVLNYKKPAFWIILIVAAALLITGVVLLTSPMQEEEPAPTSETSEITEISETSDTSEASSPSVPAGYVYPEGKGSYEKITVPEGTVVLAPHAFDGVTVGVLELPESITTIHSTSFESCTVTEKLVAGDKSYSKDCPFAEYLAEQPDIELIFDPAPAGKEKKPAVTAVRIVRFAPDTGFSAFSKSYITFPQYLLAGYDCTAKLIKINGKEIHSPQIEKDLAAVARETDSPRFLCRWKHLSDGVDYYEYPEGWAFYQLSSAYFGKPVEMNATVFVQPGTPLSAFEAKLKTFLSEENHDYFVPLSLRLHTDPVQEVEVYAGQALPLHYVPSAREYGEHMSFVGWEKIPGSNEIVYVNNLTWSKDAEDAAGFVDLWPVFAPEAITVVFRGTDYHRQSIYFGRSLGEWKLTSGNPDTVFAGWSLSETDGTPYYAPDAQLVADSATLNAIKNGELHLYPVFRPANEIVDREVLELYTKIRNYANLKSGVAGEKYTMSGGVGVTFDEAYYYDRKGQWLMSTALFLDEKPQPLTKKRMNEEAAKIFDPALLKAVNAYPYDVNMIAERDGTLWQFFVEEDLSYPIRWSIPEENLPKIVWGNDENTLTMDVEVRYPEAGFTAPLQLILKKSADGWRMVDCPLYRALFLDEGPDWITVETEGNKTARVRLGEYFSVLPEQMEKDGKPFAYWAVEGADPTKIVEAPYGEPREERLITYYLDYWFYSTYAEADGVLRLVPVYLTPDEWFESFPEEDRKTLNDAGPHGRAVKITASSYPFALIGSGWDGGEWSMPRFIWFAGSGKVIENYCIWGYAHCLSYCVVVGHGVETIEDRGISPGTRMVYLPKSLKDCMFYHPDCTLYWEKRLKNVIIYYEGSKEEFEKINFHLDGEANAFLLENARIFYNVNY